jgi:hypothetical protein
MKRNSFLSKTISWIMKKKIEKNNEGKKKLKIKFEKKI